MIYFVFALSICPSFGKLFSGSSAYNVVRGTRRNPRRVQYRRSFFRALRNPVVDPSNTRGYGLQATRPHCEPNISIKQRLARSPSPYPLYSVLSSISSKMSRSAERGSNFLLTLFFHCAFLNS